MRIQKNLKQSDVANALGISRQRYSNYENDIRQPDHNTLIQIAKYFNVSIDYLLGNDTSKTAIDNISTSLSAEEEKLLKLFGALNDEDKVTATGYIEFLTQNTKYKKSNIPHTKDEYDFDNAINRTSSVEKARKEI